MNERQNQFVGKIVNLATRKRQKQVDQSCIPITREEFELITEEVLSELRSLVNYYRVQPTKRALGSGGPVIWLQPLRPSTSTDDIFG